MADGNNRGVIKTNGNRYCQVNESQTLRTSMYGISQLLNTGLSLESLDVCIQLIEAGLHPQALAEIVTQLRREISIQRQQ